MDRRITAADVEREFITVTEMANESGQKLSTVYNWLRFHNNPEPVRVLGKTVARRSNWEEFKQEFPHLILGGEEDRGRGCLARRLAWRDGRAPELKNMGIKIYSFIYPALVLIPGSKIWGRRVAFCFLPRSAKAVGMRRFCDAMDSAETRESSR